MRREGAGRPRLTDTDAGLRPALEELVEPATRGHTMSPLRWTCKMFTGIDSNMGLPLRTTALHGVGLYHAYPVGASFVLFVSFISKSRNAQFARS